MKNSYKICVIGLGYVGLPLARLFSTKYQTVGFDMNQSLISERDYIFTVYYIVFELAFFRF